MSRIAPQRHRDTEKDDNQLVVLPAVLNFLMSTRTDAIGYFLSVFLRHSTYGRSCSASVVQLLLGDEEPAGSGRL
jgi:hypothetical protein